MLPLLNRRWALTQRTAFPRLLSPSLRMYNPQTGMEETYWLGTGAPICMGPRRDAIKSAMMHTPAELRDL